MLLDVSRENAPIFQRYFRLKAGWLGMGKLSQEFEHGLERYLGLTDRRVVSTNSCTVQAVAWPARGSPWWM